MGLNRRNAGKLPWSLVMRRMVPALAGVVRVAAFGAKKYSVDGWFHDGLSWSETWDAAQRHSIATLTGVYTDEHGVEHYGDTDPESGEPHWAHWAWGALALGTMIAGGFGVDDRD